MNAAAAHIAAELGYERRTLCMNEDSIAYDDGPGPRCAAFGVVGRPWSSRLSEGVYAPRRDRSKTESNEKDKSEAQPEIYLGARHHHLGLPCFFNTYHSHRTCMASRSRDGELLAQVMSRLDTHCVRGSSAALDGRDKGGTAAVRQMIRVAKQGEHQLVITSDGPKGRLRK